MKQGNRDDSKKSRSLQERLNQLKPHLTDSRPPLTGSGTVPPRYSKLAQSLGADLIADPAGLYCLVTKVYPFGSGFGQANVPEPGKPLPLSSFEVNHSDEHINLSAAVFFDTETTGLGGVGAVPFLIGCGSVTETGFEVRQYLLPDYSDEAAMLERVLAEFDSSRCLVSYNGRAFDVPLLRDRLIVNRVARDVPFAHHVDLLHSTRRIWRRRLQDCSLTNIEREIFGFFREDDVPGYLVPSVYFDWLGSEETGLLPAVLEHNRWDILTLYVLISRVADILDTQGADLEHVDDMYSLSRFYERRRERDKITELYHRIDEYAPQGTEPEVLWFHSLAFKRQGEWAEAVSIWQRLAESEDRESYWANLELAKYFEHRVKDAAEAYRHARRAVALCPTGGKQRDQVLTRLRRLKNRLP